MRIRTKLLFAMMVPLAVSIVQIVAINMFIRELQSAVTFISSAHSLIEADFKATDLVKVLRSDIKKLPSRYVMAQEAIIENTDPMQLSWNELGKLIDEIRSSNAIEAVPPGLLQAVTGSFSQATLEYKETTSITGKPSSMPPRISLMSSNSPHWTPETGVRSCSW